MISLRAPTRAAIAFGVYLMGCAVAVAAEPGGAGTPAAAPVTLAELMRMMSETSGVVARFIEVKRLALLEAPLETRGTLYFIPPNRMARYTNYPGESVFVIDDDRLLFEDEVGGDDIDLSANPIARVFVQNFIVLFNGDLEELERRYTPRFEAAAHRWTLQLEPRRAPLSDLIESISMHGDSDGMKSMLLREKGGDETETTFTSVDQSYQFSPEEIARVFRAENTAK